MAVKYGFYVNDEVESLAHLTILECIRKWHTGGMKFDVFCIERFFFALKARRPPEFDSLEDAVSKKKSDRAQRILDTYPEPWRTICFSVWIEGAELTEMRSKYGFSVERITRGLDVVSAQIIQQLEDLI